METYVCSNNLGQNYADCTSLLSIDSKNRLPVIIIGPNNTYIQHKIIFKPSMETDQGLKQSFRIYLFHI